MMPDPQKNGGTYRCGTDGIFVGIEDDSAISEGGGFAITEKTLRLQTDAAAQANTEFNKMWAAAQPELDTDAVIVGADEHEGSNLLSNQETRTVATTSAPVVPISFCSGCGTRLYGNKRFCSECGANTL
jgi:hypothetical protein